MRRRGLFIACVVAALSLIATALYLLPEEESGIWRGFRILLVDAAIPESEVLETLSKAGIGQILSESTEPLEISDFKGLASTFLGAAQKRLIAEDPRRDYYIEGLHRWFEAKVGTEDYRVFYIAQSFGLPSSLGIARSLTGIAGRFILPEARREASSSWIAPVFIILSSCALILAADSRKRRALVGSILLPLFIFVKSDIRLAGIALGWISLFLRAIPPLSRDFEDRRIIARGHKSLPEALLRPRDILALLPFLLPALSLSASFLPFCPSLACLVASIFFSYKAVDFAIKDSVFFNKRAFNPLRIGSARSALEPRTKADRRFVIACYCAALLSLLAPYCSQLATKSSDVGGIGSANSISLPLPLALKQSPRPKPAEAENLASMRKEGELVDISDWLIHRWHEESFFYAALDSSSREAFSPVLLPSAEASKSMEKDFGDTWANQAYRSIEKISLEALMIGQGGYIRCSILPLGSRADGPLAPMESLLYIILLVPLALGLLFLGTSGSRQRRERKSAA